MIRNKHGQITIFVILAILIVVAIVLIFTLYQNSLLSVTPSVSENPQRFFADCLNVNLQEIVDTLIGNGGYIEVGDPYFDFEYEKVPYHCYTSEDRKQCEIQEPVLITHLEKEIHNALESRVENCFEQLESELEKKGYDVSLDREFDFQVELKPNKAEIIARRKLLFEKSEISRTIREFRVEVNSPLYDLAIIIQEITKQEAKYCNSDYPMIMRMRHWVKIAKFQTGDDNKVYTVTDDKTDKSMRFAVRGCVQPTPT